MWGKTSGLAAEAKRGFLRRPWCQGGLTGARGQDRGQEELPRVGG